jgi:hypothetical protein
MRGSSTGEWLKDDFAPKGLSATILGLKPLFDAPQRLQNSAQGFNPGNRQNKRFALKLKGREMRVLGEARTYCHPKVRVRNWDVLQLDHRTPLGPG